MLQNKKLLEGETLGRLEKSVLAQKRNLRKRAPTNDENGPNKEEADPQPGRLRRALHWAKHT